MNLAFLASHRGSNMQSIIDACKSGALAANPVVVISNNADSGALSRAREEGIPAHHLSSLAIPDEDELDKRITDTLLECNTDLVVLAGYMKRIGKRTLAAFPGKIINIHPCLLPKYGGQGMYGMRVHEAVIASGDKESGVTIHVVNAEYDKGAILAQQKVLVKEGDSAESLAERVLAVEHSLYTETIAKIVSGEIALPGAEK
ncbi:MAG: phosphoribosylglycinamide formyltransferase [Gammaproteobacteria bacterium]|jgi:phosphoribosylglycinamide formyltransferase 1|nr:phosphoribosylglycinamide formyltransferase [Gammaproteobacteria bacterium]